MMKAYNNFRQNIQRSLIDEHKYNILSHRCEGSERF